MGARTGNPHQFGPTEIEAEVSSILLRPLPATAYPLLAAYLELLTHWNSKMNLTAVRDPTLLVRLHLAECLRAAQTIPAEVETVLDFGSGAGLPGVPIQIVRPQLRVTLAESQKKKGSFLREVVRELDLSGATVHAGRVEDMPQALVFDLVTLRAVDNIASAVQAALPRIRYPQGDGGGMCMILTSAPRVPEMIAAGSLLEKSAPVEIEWQATEPIPGTTRRVILLGRRIR
jgi:16S rRNA (guanine527-N7)-methyltransferase